jgi:hypothetical protein
MLASAPKALVFKRVVANGIPAQVIVPIAGLTAAAPAELCTGGSGRWETWLIDSSDTSQGVIGAFWPDCSAASSTSGSGASTGGGSAGDDQRLCENSDTAVAKISPCTGPSGTTIHLTLRRNLQSAPSALMFKRVLVSGVPAQVGAPVTASSASSPPQLCVTGGDGKWEVWLTDANGTSQGVIGSFWPECGGADKCLTGSWKSESVTNPGPVGKRGGSGIVLSVKSGGVATIDYNGMQPIEDVAPNGMVMDTTIYSGTATAYISTKNNSLFVGKMQNSALTSKITYNNGKSTGGSLSGLGFVFYGGGKVAGYNLNYVCNGPMLVIKHVLAPSQVLQIFTFKRQ